MYRYHRGGSPSTELIILAPLGKAHDAMVQTTTRGFTTRCPVATAPTGPRLPAARPGRGSAEGTAQTHPRHPEARPGSGLIGVPRRPSR